MTSSSHPCCSSLEERVERLEAALAWIAWHTSHLPSNKVAYAALSDEDSPLMAEVRADLAAREVSRGSNGRR